MEHLCTLSEKERQKVKEFLQNNDLQDNEKFQPLSPSEKTELKNCLLKFVKRICDCPRIGTQGEFAVLPEIVKILLQLR